MRHPPTRVEKNATATERKPITAGDRVPVISPTDWVTAWMLRQVRHARRHEPEGDDHANGLAPEAEGEEVGHGAEAVLVGEAREGRPEPGDQLARERGTDVVQITSNEVLTGATVPPPARRRVRW